MNVVRTLPLPGWRWFLVALVIGVLVSIAVPAYAISGKRWTTPDNIQDVSFDASGNMWSKTYYNSKIISLAPGTDQLTTWTHPNTAIIGATGYGRAVRQASSTFVWQIQQSMDHVNRLDTSGGQLLSWAFPAGNTCGDPRNLAVDPAGDAWFGKTDQKIGHLIPGTNTYEEWPMPTAGSYCPRVTGTEGSGDTLKVWFCEPEIDKIGFLSPSSGGVTEWTIPGNPSAFDSCNPPANGNIWFSNATAHVKRLDIATNELKTWPCQAGCSIVRGVSQEAGGKVWFGDYTDLTSFDPAANGGIGQFVEYTGLSCGVYLPWIEGANVWTTGAGTVTCRFDTFP